jgi:hypothetical protein
MLQHIRPGGLFFYPTIVSTIALLSLLFGAGAGAFFTAVLLVILEVTLSFDNAVVNAKILKDMSLVWQKRFLTWGILFAVFGTRVILPVVIVALVSGISPIVVGYVAVMDPARYAELLHGAHHAIAAFGSAFLFMVSLKYFFDETKQVHWIQVIEHKLAKWGDIEALEIAFVLSLLLGLTSFIPEERATILAAGIIGVVIFVCMEGVTHTMKKHAKTAGHAGLAGFLYLNVLDSAFSLDGVIGAFAITTNLMAIIVGLGIGAYFVRSMTIYLVRAHTLSLLPYLEHGAHWAIFGLAASMACSLVVEVPEVLTALIGLMFIVASYRSSVIEQAHKS